MRTLFLMMIILCGCSFTPEEVEQIIICPHCNESLYDVPENDGTDLAEESVQANEYKVMIPLLEEGDMLPECCPWCHAKDRYPDEDLHDHIIFDCASHELKQPYDVVAWSVWLHGCKEDPPFFHPYDAVCTAIPEDVAKEVLEFIEKQVPYYKERKCEDCHNGFVGHAICGECGGSGVERRSLTKDKNIYMFLKENEYVDILLRKFREENERE